MNDLISIIVPVYKVEKYLDRCVESLIAQTYQNIEIILVDDGSPDNCPAMCDDFAKTDSRIKIIHKKNGGLSDARNYGMKESTGNYLLFIDSDDFIHKETCEYLIKTANKYKADIVSVEMILFNNDDEIHSYAWDDIQIKEQILSGETIIIEYLKQKKERTIYHGLCMKIYKRELFEGLSFAVGRLHEDVFITYRLLDRCQKLILSNVPYYFYYQNNNSICHTYGIKNFNDLYDALEQIKAYFKNREQLKPYLCEFVTYEYRSMLIKMIKCDNDEVRNKIKIMKMWIFKHLKYLNVSKKKKVVCFVSVLFPNIFIHLKKMTGEENL